MVTGSTAQCRKQKNLLRFYSQLKDESIVHKAELQKKATLQGERHICPDLQSIVLGQNAVLHF